MELTLDRTASITSGGGGDQPSSPGGYPANMALHVGVLHYSPTWEPFPLLADLSRWVVVLCGSVWSRAGCTSCFTELLSFWQCVGVPLRSLHVALKRNPSRLHSQL